MAVFACFLTGWPVLVPRHVVAGRVSFSLWAQMALDNSRMMAENLERKKTLDVAKKKYKTKYDKAQYRASTVTLPVKCPGGPLPPAAHSPLPGVVFFTPATSFRCKTHVCTPAVCTTARISPVLSTRMLRGLRRGCGARSDIENQVYGCVRI